MHKLVSNLKINEEGLTYIPYKILKEYIKPSLTKIPFEFNDSENQIMTDTGVNQTYIDAYERKIAKQNRKYLYFEVVEKKVKKSENKIQDIIDSVSDKLISLGNLSDLEETIQDIENLYVLEKNYCFYFNRAKYLKKFINKIFDVELLIPENKKKTEQIIFNFKSSIDDITPRTLTTKINQGTLLIHKDGPPKVIKHFMNKNYVIIKLYSLMENHSDDLKDIYDILITCKEEILNRVFQNENYNNPNAFFGIYSSDSQNFYISKLIFKEFLKTTGQKFLYINNSLSNEVFEIPFDEESYDEFLTKSNYYEESYLSRLKDKSSKGISKYYNYFKDFLAKEKYNNSSIDNTLLKQLKKNLEHLDFTNISKREIFIEDVNVHFLNDMDILITRDHNLNIDYSSNLILDGLKINFKKGKKLFITECDGLLKDKELSKLDEDSYKNVFNLLKNLKYTSLLNLHPEFVRDSCYHISILKNNSDLLKKYIKITDSNVLDTIAIIIGVQNAFRKYFPKENSLQYYNKFFISNFENFPEINKQMLFKIQRYCYDMIFMFNAAQDFKLLSKEFKDKFSSNGEFKSVFNYIKELIDNRLNFQNEFKGILEEFKKGVKHQKESKKSLEEFKLILEQKLKDEFINVAEYTETVKSIEEILKSKMKPIIDYESILKQIDSYFKEKNVSKEQVDEIVEYIDENLKNKFEDRNKYNSLIKKIRKIYDSKFENEKQYSKILDQIDKSFETINTKKDIAEFKTYIEENLKNIFKSDQDKEIIFRQIENDFSNKVEHSKEIEDIIHLSFGLVKLLISDTIFESILTGSIFGLFILALKKENEIPLSSICEVLDILPTSLSLQVKKVIETERTKKGKRMFDDLKITDEKTRQRIRFRLVELLLGSLVYQIFKSKNDDRIKRLIDEFKRRINFFNRYDMFTDSLKKVSKKLIDTHIKDFIPEIKQITKIEERNLKLSKLTSHLTFFNDFDNFKKYLISLESEIKEIYNEMPPINFSSVKK